MELYGSLVANEGSGGGDGTVDVPIKSISVNGSGVVPVNKNVNIEVPTKLSQLEDDSSFVTEDDLTAKVNNQFATASGDYITATDSVDGNIVELGVKGNSFQQTYTGKNLFDCNTMFPASGEKNGITLTNNGDGSYSLNGTATNDSQLSYNFNHEETVNFFKYGAGIYTLSVKDAVKAEHVNAFQCTLYKYDGTNNIYNWHVNSTKKSNSYNITQEMLDNKNFFIAFMFWVKSGVTVNQTFYPQLEFGSEATEYEPYVGGIPAPNPSYPQEIKSIGDDGSLVVMSCGKNVLKNTNINNSSKGITYTKNSDGSISCTGTQTGHSYYKLNDDLKVDFKRKYILSGNTTTNSNEWGYCLFLQLELEDGSSRYIFNNNPDEVVADFSQYPTLRRIRSFIRIGKDATPLTDKTVTFYPMLRPYGTDGTYEPYKESTTTIPLSEPLRAIGDVKDEITYQNGKLGVLRRIKETTINSATKINPAGALTGTMYDIMIDFGTIAKDSYSVVNKVSDVSKHIFSNFQSKLTWNEDVCGAYISWAGGTFARMSSSICGSTLDEVNLYLKDNPITMDYVLAEPVFEPFSDQTLPYLSTYDGVTNISNDDALSAEMTVKYPTTDASGVGSRNESRIADIEGTVGSTDISDISDGTVTGAIDEINTWRLNYSIPLNLYMGVDNYLTIIMDSNDMNCSFNISDSSGNIYDGSLLSYNDSFSVQIKKINSSPIKNGYIIGFRQTMNSFINKLYLIIKVSDYSFINGVINIPSSLKNNIKIIPNNNPNLWDEGTDIVVKDVATTDEFDNYTKNIKIGKSEDVNVDNLKDNANYIFPENYTGNSLNMPSIFEKKCGGVLECKSWGNCVTQLLYTYYSDFSMIFTRSYIRMGNGEYKWTSWIRLVKEDQIGNLSLYASGTTLSITNGTHTWTLEANS